MIKDGATIAVWQALLIAAFYYLSQSCWLGGLGYWTLYRPLIGGALVGLVLGNPAAGLAAGAVINLAYIGQSGVGGTLPADMALAGYVGSALVVAGGLDTETALALMLPVGLLGVVLYQLRMTLSAAFVRGVDRQAAVGNTRGLVLANVLPSQLLLAALTIPVCFAAVYWGPSALDSVLAVVPGWLLRALTLMGGLLPAVGLAQLMAYLWKGDTLAAFALGFVAAALAGMPILGVSVVIAALAWLVTRPLPQNAPSPPTAEGVLSEEQPVDLLKRGDVFRSWLHWLFFSHACYNWERMQGTGFAQAMVPLARRIPDTHERAELLQRHTAFFNTEPNLGGFIVGVTLGMEEQRLALGGDGNATEITAIKSALMGPVSGIGDSLLQAALGSALISAAVGGALEGTWSAPVLYVLAMIAIIWGGGWLFFRYGYRAGAEGLPRLMEGVNYHRVLAIVEMTGAGVLGALSALYVSLGSLSTEGGIVAWLGPLLVLFIAWLRRHKVSIHYILMGVILVAFVLALAGI